MKPSSNQFICADLKGKRVTLSDGRKGVVTNGGYGRVSIDLDDGYWVNGERCTDNSGRGIKFSVN